MSNMVDIVIHKLNDELFCECAKQDEISYKKTDDGFSINVSGIQLGVKIEKIEWINTISCKVYSGEKLILCSILDTRFNQLNATVDVFWIGIKDVIAGIKLTRHRECIV